MRILFVLFLFLASLPAAHAQYIYEEPHIIDSTSDFCMLVHDLIEQSASRFDIVKDMDSAYSQLNNAVPVKKKYCFAASWKTYIEEVRGVSRYAAIFMVRDNREELLSSYSNLLSQLKQCLPGDCPTDEKKSRLFTINDYSFRPVMPDGRKLLIRIRIQEALWPHNYRLRLDISSL